MKSINFIIHHYRKFEKTKICLKSVLTQPPPPLPTPQNILRLILVTFIAYSVPISLFQSPSGGNEIKKWVDEGVKEISCYQKRLKKGKCQIVIC